MPAAKYYYKDSAKYQAEARSYEHTNRKKYKRKPITKRRYDLKSKYGLSLDDYDAMVHSQKGCCGACGGPPTGKDNKLMVDHNHTTNEIRGLLCHQCNLALGLIRDDPTPLRALATYLEGGE